MTGFAPLELLKAESRLAAVPVNDQRGKRPHAA